MANYTFNKEQQNMRHLAVIGIGLMALLAIVLISTHEEAFIIAGIGLMAWAAGIGIVDPLAKVIKKRFFNKEQHKR